MQCKKKAKNIQISSSLIILENYIELETIKSSFLCKIDLSRNHKPLAHQIVHLKTCYWIQALL